ncbi:MAG: hypothetical protein QOG23_1502 [Blastocatellia bacterium]|jgi:hypothetical protein|nr:hypothetical protein [Blastocatellia bacterium]
MEKPTSLLDLITLRLSLAGSDSSASLASGEGGSTLAMATLLGSTSAVTTYGLIAGSEQDPVLLHFDFWPEPFTISARVSSIDRESDLAFLKLESALPKDKMPRIETGTRSKSGEQWKSLLPGLAGGNKRYLTGRTLDYKGRNIRLQTTGFSPSLPVPIGAPVIVENVLIGIVSGYRSINEKDGELLAFSAKAILTIDRKRIIANPEEPQGKKTTEVRQERVETASLGKSDSTVDFDSLFNRLSPASLRALGHAEGIQRKLKGGVHNDGRVHTEQLIAGLYHKEDGELRVLMRTAELDGDSLFEILDTQFRERLPRLGEYEPVTLLALPPLSRHLRAAVINAQKAADEDKSEAINNWHLLYGVLAVEDCDLALELAKRGLVKEKVRRGPSPERSSARGTTRPNIAGFTSDDPRKGPARFGIDKEVKALCSVLAAKSVEPPLSLGLFGDWGSGKSFFMGQMEKEFIRLKEKARADKNSPYCPNIVQLWFNAWHYMDMNLWASLASEIFEGLAEELTKDEKLDVGKTDPATARARLLAATASKKDVLVDAERRKNFAETELKASEERLNRLEETDKELNDSLSLQAVSRAAYRFVVNQPDVRANIELAGAALNLSQVQRAATETKAELLELKGLWGHAKALYLAIRNAKSRWAWFTLLVCLALVIIAVPLLLRYKDQLAGLRGVVTSLAIGLGGLVVAVSPYLAGVRRALKIVNDARAENNALIEQKRTERREMLVQQQTQVREKLQDASQRVQEASHEVRQLEQQLDELRADRQMATFIKQRNESSDYINQLGTIARARNDFEKLSDLLAEVRKQTLAEAKAAAQKKDARAEGGPDAAATNGNPPKENLLLPRIDRIVLYIDDLDRCPENKVVEVLQAVHLLLAFPLFVVIVGVDPRWLLHSLKQHSKVFQGAAPEAGNGGSDEEERHWQSTPLNYLEKIFQIPFTLRPMAYDGFGEYIEDLAQTAVDEGQKGVPDGGAGTANKTAPSQPVDESTGDTLAPPVDEKPTTDTSAVGAPDALKQIADQSSQGAKQKVTADATARASASAQKEEKSDGEADLPPEHLRIEDWEREYMKRLFWLMPSPRAAKRFVNIYRLLRASVPEEKQAAFVGETRQGEHRVALLLLAIVTGYPTEAADILRELLKQERSRIWWQFIDEFETQNTIERRLDQEGNPEEELSEAEAENLRQLFKNLREVRKRIPDNQSCADFIDWAPEVARYSFQSGRVLLTQRDTDNSDDD